MRVLFCGSGSFAMPSLQAIMETDHDVVGVVTQPPRRAGRGGQVRPTLVAAFARDEHLPLLEPPSINAADCVAAIAEMRPDVICVAEFGQMIGKAVRDLATVDTFNLHGSLLPELRGAAPVNWAIIRGYKRTGVTTFSLVDRMDAGPIHLREGIDIAPSETAQSLRVRLADIGSALVCRTLALLAGGGGDTPAEQDESLATYAPLMSKPDGIVRWDRSAETVRDLVHGTWPWPGAHAVFGPKAGRMTPVIIASAAAEESTSAGEPGTIDETSAVHTARGRLRILQVKPAGKRLMAWRDFVNGHRVKEGDAFVVESDPSRG